MLESFQIEVHKMDIDDDVPLAKIAKVSTATTTLPPPGVTTSTMAAAQNKMLQNMENILNSYKQPQATFYPDPNKQFDPRLPDLNLEMSILVDDDEDVQTGGGPQMTPLKNQLLAPQETSEKAVKHIPEVPMEYEWPVRSGEFFVLKESVATFLDVTENDASLEGLEARRVEDEDERNHILSTGIVKVLPQVMEAVRNEHVFQFLCENNKAKFQLYIEGVHTCEMRKLVERQEAQRREVIKGNVSRVLKRTLQETVKYNSRLNSERRESRQAYFDLQAQIIHLPQKKPTYDPDRKSKFSRYPLALLPGQYQDYFKSFTPEELSRLPLNTITSFPCPKKKSEPEPEETAAAVDDELNETNAEMSISPLKKSSEEKSAAAAAISAIQPDKDPFCGICMKGPEMNKRGLAEKLIHCHQCVNSGHPSCLDMNRNLVTVIASYPWQCMECKVSQVFQSFSIISCTNFCRIHFQSFKYKFFQNSYTIISCTNFR